MSDRHRSYASARVLAARLIARGGDVALASEVLSRALGALRDAPDAAASRDALRLARATLRPEAITQLSELETGLGASPTRAPATRERARRRPHRPRGAERRRLRRRPRRRLARAALRGRALRGHGLRAALSRAERRADLRRGPPGVGAMGAERALGALRRVMSPRATVAPGGCLTGGWYGAKHGPASGAMPTGMNNATDPHGVNTIMRNALSLSLGAAVLAMTSLAGAQDVTVSTTAAQPSNTTSTGGSITDTSGPTDHSVVVGRLGLRYFGTTRAAALVSCTGGPQPVDDAPAPGAPDPRLQLHTVGMRYWLNNSLGIEAGLSFGERHGWYLKYRHRGTNRPPLGRPQCLRVRPPRRAADSSRQAKHISIQIAPYFNLAYAAGGLQWSTRPDQMDANDFLRNTSLSFFRLELGATAQAELQFGFLGAPQLGLIAQFGVGLGFQTRSVTTDILLSRQQTANTTSNSRSGFEVGTTIGNFGLADIITGSLAAVWYFGGGR